jgi:hypothetical protein
MSVPRAEAVQYPASLARGAPIRGRGQQQRRLDVGVRRTHVIDLDDLAVFLLVDAVQKFCAPYPTC